MNCQCKLYVSCEINECIMRACLVQGQLISLFTSDPFVIEKARQVLPIIAFLMVSTTARLFASAFWSDSERALLPAPRGKNSTSAYSARIVLTGH